MKQLPRNLYIRIFMIVVVCITVSLPSFSTLATDCHYGNTFENLIVQNGKIVFETNRDGNSEIYTMGHDGSNPTRLTNSIAQDADPFFNKNATQIVFVSQRDGNPEIYVMSSDGSNQTRITSTGVGEGRPAFSPDGTKILFGRGSGNAAEIYVMNVNGTNEVQLTNNAFEDTRGKWSPTGDKIIFNSDRDGNSDIYTMNANGTNVVNLTNDNSPNGEPSFSPDGTKIVFFSSRSGNSEVYVANADGSNVQNLSNNSANDGSCAWTADGQKILFSSNRDTGPTAEIYIMSATDGSGVVRLTNNSSLDNTPISGALLVATSGEVSVGGRIATPGGSGISGAAVTMSDNSGNIVTVISNPLGYYQFSNVTVGNTYVFSVIKKQYSFSAQFVTVKDEISNLDFIANP